MCLYQPHLFIPSANVLRIATSFLGAERGTALRVLLPAQGKRKSVGNTYKRGTPPSFTFNIFIRQEFDEGLMLG